MHYRRGMSALSIVLLLLLQATVILDRVFGRPARFIQLQTTSSDFTTPAEFKEQPGTMSPPEQDQTALGSKSDWFEPMVMSLDYREQLGNALNSLFDLQCWTRTVKSNIGKVVEPSVKGISESVFHFLPDEKVPKFSDWFDLTHWNKMSAKHNFPLLVSREHFLKHAIKDIIFVQIIYKLHPTLCLPDHVIMKQDWYTFLVAKGFRLVTTACIDFTKIRNHFLTEESFRDRIFKDTRHNVTVVFNVWEGIRAKHDIRVALNGSRCNTLLSKMANVKFSALRPSEPVHINISSSSPISPSERISELTQRFLSEFLSGERFIAIMMRTEKMDSLIFEKPLHNSCVKNMLSDWTRLTKAKNVSKTLFFSDADSHGSITLHSSPKRTFAKYIHNSLNLELTSDKVNAYLERITGSRDSVQIAVLTRQIVARATCVMTIGGGLFQRQALNMFAHNHKDQELCYSVRNTMCDSEYINHVYDGDPHTD